MTARLRRLPALLCLCLAAAAQAMTPAELAGTRNQAERGSAAAQLLLGIAYASGDGGLPVDGRQAAHWLEQSALQGNAAAEARLGDLYAEGRGLPQDWRLAADWWRRAAARGDVDAGFKIGHLYLLGRGVARDPEKAARWLARAASGGNGEAAHLLREVIGEFGHSEDRPLSAQALQRLAEDGDSEAQLSLARHYEQGSGGVSRDAAAALAWRQRAAAGTQ